MELEIKKDKRCISNSFIKMPYGISNKEAKQYAMECISEYVKYNKDFGERNYIYIEYVIRYSIENNKCIINVNPNI